MKTELTETGCTKTTAGSSYQALTRSRALLALAHLRRSEGMATAEYAIGTVAAAAFAGLLLAIMRSGSLQGALQSILESALVVN